MQIDQDVSKNATGVVQLDDERVWQDKVPAQMTAPFTMVKIACFVTIV